MATAPVTESVWSTPCILVPCAESSAMPCYVSALPTADDPFKGFLISNQQSTNSSQGTAASLSSSRFLLPPDPLTDASANLAATFSRQDVINLLAVLANRVSVSQHAVHCRHCHNPVVSHNPDACGIALDSFRLFLRPHVMAFHPSCW